VSASVGATPPFACSRRAGAGTASPVTDDLERFSNLRPGSHCISPIRTRKLFLPPSSILTGFLSSGIFVYNLRSNVQGRPSLSLPTETQVVFEASEPERSRILASCVQMATGSSSCKEWSAQDCIQSDLICLNVHTLTRCTPAYAG